MKNKNNDIGEQEILIMLDLAVKLDNQEITRAIALQQLDKAGIKRSNANYYFSIYPYLLKGKLFKGSINATAMRYYLDNILELKGFPFLQNALQTFSLHFDYYEGVTGTSVIEKREILKEYLEKYNIKNEEYFDEEISNKEILKEGVVKQITVNIYERNPIARSRCIDHHKAICKVCGFDFEINYGIIGKGFIHVHHVVDISTIRDEYEVDYINDLIPVCPNCHAMLHRRKPAYTIEELKEIMKRAL